MRLFSPILTCAPLGKPPPFIIDLAIANLNSGYNGNIRQRQMISIRRQIYTPTYLRVTISPAAEEHGQAEITAGGAVSERKAPAARWFPTKAQEVVIPSSIEALWVRHILLQTRSLADEVFQLLKRGKRDFDEIARTLSDCMETRNSGGEIGWVGIESDHLDGILGLSAREYLLGHCKPGDIAVLETDRGVHVVRVDDVMTKLLQSVRKRRKSLLPRFRKQHVIHSTAAAAGLQGGGNAGKKNLVNDIHKKYFVETLGCQMNVADSERMKGQLENLGLDEAEKKEDASVLILNTCSIRDKAEQKVYGHVGQYALRKRKGDDVAIVVAGCVAQQEGENLLRRVPEIDLVMGPQYVNRLGDLLEDVTFSGSRVVATDPMFISADLTKPKRSSTVRAWVNIIYGCNEHCSYCIVPDTRGVEQSRPRESIREEIQALGKEGHREVCLLGQNVDAYGRDMHPKRTFADLLHYINDVQGIERIRFVTSHPRYMSERVVDMVANLDKVCECFLVPFQSGSDAVLRRMRRGYTYDSYMRIIDRIKRLVPDASICGDVIVGFPGETDADFDCTLKLMEDVKFDNLNPRPNTEAAKWTNQVPEDIAAERLQRLNRLSMHHAMERSQRYLGCTVEVLVEEINVKVMGRNRQNRPVFFQGNIDELKGKFINVLVEEARPWSLTGTRTGGAW